MVILCVEIKFSLTFYVINIRDSSVRRKSTLQLHKIYMQKQNLQTHFQLWPCYHDPEKRELLHKSFIGQECAYCSSI